MSGINDMGPADFRAALDDVRSRSADYGWLWEACAAAPDANAEFASLRERVDPERPFFIGELSNGVRFAGDARDFPSALHALYPDTNRTLVDGLIGVLGESGGDVVDIGANLGVVSSALARHLGSRGAVLSFEPSPATALITAATLALNGVENARLIEAAASDIDGEVTFHAAEGNSAVASVLEHEFAYLNTWREIAVQARRLDTFDLENVALVKIDVEGHESAVLRGAAETIRRCAPVVVYEFTPVVARTLGWSCEASMDLASAGRPYAFRALTEPDLRVPQARGRWVSFPLPNDVEDQVNVFATPL